MDSNEDWFIGAIASVIAFLFGSSGIFQKGFDYLLGRFKTNSERELTEIEKRDKQIQDLTHQVDELKGIIGKLDRDIIKTTTYVKTLLSYLETLMPDGANPFIAEMAKEIRQNTAHHDDK